MMVTSKIFCLFFYMVFFYGGNTHFLSWLVESFNPFLLLFWSLFFLFLNDYSFNFLFGFSSMFTSTPVFCFLEFELS